MLTLILTSIGPAWGLNVAIEVADDPCYRAKGEVIEGAVDVIEAAGHTVTVVAGVDIDTAEEIDAFDVVVLGAGGFGCDWDWLTFDKGLQDYVDGGGGIVATGWVAYYMASNTRSETYAGLAAVLPVEASTSLVQNTTVTPVAGHPITDGVSPFANASYASFGPVKKGAAILTGEDDADTSAAWSVGGGRSVYLGPVYLANWSGYANEGLLDGTQPDAISLFTRSIAWAGMDDDFDTVREDVDNCPGLSNADQANADADSFGDACDDCPNDADNDLDQDDLCGDVDPCPADADNDIDEDGICGDVDPCPLDPLDDVDQDGICGDVDACPDDAGNDVDGDEICAPVDNCPDVANADQSDEDGDGVGDACAAELGCDGCQSSPAGSGLGVLAALICLVGVRRGTRPWTAPGRD